MNKLELELSTHAQIAALVHAFESGELPLCNWTHRAHLAAGAFYVRSMPFPIALLHMRSQIQRYNLLNNNPTGYNETITRLFLAKMVSDLLSGKACESLPDEVNRLSETCTLSWLYGYYSKECLHSSAAKKGWVEPDIRQIEFMLVTDLEDSATEA